VTAANPIAPWLKEWLATVPPGHCPACRRALPAQKGRGRPAYVHSKAANPECRAEYQRRYHLSRSTSGLKEVRSVKPLRHLPGWVAVKLSCGCSKRLNPVEARRLGPRAYCPKHSPTYRAVRPGAHVQRTRPNRL
jgi:hypothetical protein